MEYIMKTLTLNTFTSSVDDIEISQYKILSSLRDYQAEFNKNKLFPALSELTYLYSTLEELLAHKSCFNLLLPNGISSMNKSKNSFIEIVDQSTEQRDYVYDLIEWALPVIQNLIDEAHIIYYFILDNLSIKQKGISVLDNKSGYLLVPDNLTSQLNVYRFDTVENFRDNKSNYILNTEYLQSTKLANLPSITWYIEKELKNKYFRDENTSSYLCHTDLDFPYNETMFPLARTKLLSFISD
jgi:hypothetical protein